MSKISTWSTTAANNNSAAPDGFPEGMNPSDVNNAAREVMAAVRTQHEDAQWIDYGHTVTFASTTTFTVATDLTATYDVGRRVKCTDASTLYGTITASSYSAPNTTVTVSLDSGSLSASLTAVAVGIVSGTNNSLDLAQHGVTATATELNILDGATVSTADLNTVGSSTDKLNTKVIDIGDWNMDTTSIASVPHDLTLSKIRNISVIIRNDTDTEYDDFASAYDSSQTTDRTCHADATNIVMRRATAGHFDNTGYDSTSYNRGWITIQYTD